jgi:hypothetical protein
MNRGFFGVRSKANGQGAGLQRWTMGFDYASQTEPPSGSESLAANTFKQYAVRIIPSKSCLLASIDIFVAGNASNVQLVTAGIASDGMTAAAGGVSKPTLITAVNAYGHALTGSFPQCDSGLLDATPRWVSVPMTVWLKGGVPVWLIGLVGNGCAIYYNDYASGSVLSDCYEESASNGVAYLVCEANITWTQSTKMWAIRGSLIA